MDALTGIPWAALTMPGLVSLFVLGLLRGDVVPRKVHEAMLAQEVRNTERMATVLESLAPVVEEMSVELARTTAAILQARKGEA